MKWLRCEPQNWLAFPGSVPCPKRISLFAGLAFAILVFAACAPAAQLITTAPTEPLPAEIPAIPFADNPDPTLCGIPEPDGREGVAHGEVDGELYGPIIYLYESHLRETIIGQIYPGSAVEIVMRQSNPTLDYYFVKTIGIEPVQEGWIPAPFVEVRS